MSPTAEITLACEQLTVNVPGRRLVNALSCAFYAGELLAVLGKNGAGKSLTLHTLAGLRRPDSGDVSLFGESLASLSRQRIACQLSLLPQVDDDAFPATVFATALSGRHPHVPRLQWESADDFEKTERVLAEMDLLELRERDVATLSGGERRRLAVAQVLAQAPDVYLLDEPSNHLDPQHQLDVLNVFRRRANNGATVVASLHDVNLAARFADRCLLLFGDGRWLLGPSSDVLCADRLSELFATTMEAIAWRDRQLFIAAG